MVYVERGRLRRCFSASAEKQLVRKTRRISCVHPWFLGRRTQHVVQTVKWRREPKQGCVVQK